MYEYCLQVLIFTADPCLSPTFTLVHIADASKDVSPASSNLFKPTRTLRCSLSTVWGQRTLPSSHCLKITELFAVQCLEVSVVLLTNYRKPKIGEIDQHSTPFTFAWPDMITEAETVLWSNFILHLWWNKLEIHLADLFRVTCQHQLVTDEQLWHKLNKILAFISV